jgi:hypothetical protein
MLFVQFMVQFIHFLPGFFEGSFSGGCDLVESSPSAFDAIEGRAQQARSFQPVQKRIERAGADAVAVVREFLHHGESEDGLVHGVQQHVDANKTVEEFALLIYHKNKYTSANVSRP